MHCDDLLSRWVAESDSKLMSGKNKDMAVQAEEILGRLKKVMDESNRSSTLAYGELSIKIAEVVLGKVKDGSITERTDNPPHSACMVLNS